MISSNAGRNRSFWRSSRGLATASPNADDPPPNRTNRPKREFQIARKPLSHRLFPAKSITSLVAFRQMPQRSRNSSRTTNQEIAQGASPHRKGVARSERQLHIHSES